MLQVEDSVEEQIQFLKRDRQLAIRNHPLFGSTQKYSDVEREFIFGQYWHLLNYFPNFLAQVVRLSPNRRSKVMAAQVLAEELGNGISIDAHETAFLEAMEDQGFDLSKIQSSPMIFSTAHLMNGYYASENNYQKVLGYFLATEVADIWITTCLGGLLSQGHYKRSEIRWVSIHTKQEPGHVSATVSCLGEVQGKSELDKIFSFAGECSRLWDDFFSGIFEEINNVRKKLEVSWKCS